MSEMRCAVDCKGILLSGDPYTGDWSGCSCASGLLANGQPQPAGYRCDCPQHPTLDKPGRCQKAMWWGDGAPAGLCGEPAFGPCATLVMACERHGGPGAPRSEEGKAAGAETGTPGKGTP